MPKIMFRTVQISVLVFCLAGHNVASAKSGSESKFKVTESGVGTFNAKTQVDQAEIQKLFPKEKVASDQLYSEGEPVSESVKVSKADKVILEFVSDGVKSKKLFSLIIRDTQYTTPLGLHAGSSVESFLKAAPSRICNRGVEESQGEAHCFLPNSKIVYSFPLAKEEEGVEAGTRVKIKAAKGRKIESLVWKSEPQK